MRDDCFEARTAAFQGHLAKAGVAVALISDEDSIYYFSGYLAGRAGR
jgi:hypothetical protein